MSPASSCPCLSLIQCMQMSDTVISRELNLVPSRQKAMLDAPGFSSLNKSDVHFLCTSDAPG